MNIKKIIKERQSKSAKKKNKKLLKKAGTHFTSVTASEGRFRALTEKSSDAIALVNSQGKVLYASLSTKEVMGYTPEEFKKLTNPFELVPPDERKVITKLFEKLLKEPGGVERSTYQIMHKGGYSIWVKSVMTNLLNDPNVGAIVINYSDITKEKELEQQKDNFLGAVSHELKTPVSSIKAYGQLLETMFRSRGDPKAAELLGKMGAQIDRLDDLIADLFDVTKVYSGRLQFHEDYFDFNQLVVEKVEEMQHVSEKHQMIKKLNSVNKVFGDRERIGQVLTNFISNAIKYSPNADKIIIATSSNKTTTTLCVSDSGIGIRETNLERVFEQFFRVNGPESNTFPGLGLGLYISSEIIKREGGKIWVKKNKGKGSIFCFSLPTKKNG